MNVCLRANHSMMTHAQSLSLGSLSGGVISGSELPETQDNGGLSTHPLQVILYTSSTRDGVLAGYDNNGAGTIGRIRFTDTAGPGGPDNFGINQLSLAAGTAAVPEPSTLTHTGLRMLGLAAWLRKRKKASG